MFGIDQHRQSTSNTQTSVDNSQVTQDNRVAVQTGTVLTSAGGALTDNTGAIVGGAGGTISISSIDPGSYAFASHVADIAARSGSEAIDTAAKASSDAIGAVRGAVSTFADSVGKLAQGTPIGTDWKARIVPLSIVGALVLGLLVWFIKRNK